MRRVGSRRAVGEVIWSTTSSRVPASTADCRVSSPVYSSCTPTDTARMGRSTTNLVPRPTPSLATATELVTRGNWVTVAIDDIVQEIVRPFRDEQSQRVTISGPPMLINSRDATSLGMALHELCTNAVKYGALSSERGSVSIDWSRDADGRLHLRWRERDGPPVSAAHGKGSGTRLLTAGLFDPGTGSVELRFEPDGVACDIHLVLGNVAAD